ncbi:hypothetical protein [Flavobacterium pallidum]|uniref:General secretion pathway protein n=1 Tax=Flavobacterium pallidum TaxID=2172098 RepID=A0A2S1SFV5_9FLAO|nr:hypothetical protein [Flavobacterium pallidum]AWI25296.1 hypothetical protein HYN49_04940 [Flavobacterium pallidum]
MSRSRLERILIGNKFVGMELFSQNGSDAFTTVWIENKAEELNITNAEQGNNLEDLSIQLAGDLPISLVINDSQIIHKEINDAEQNGQRLFYKAFPNAKIEDFHYEIWRLHSKAIVAICRKEHIDNVLGRCAALKLNIVSVSLGICVLSQLEEFIADKEISVRNQSINLDNDGKIMETRESSAQSFDINGLQIQSGHLPAFAAVLGFYVNNRKNSGSTHDYNALLTENYQQNRFFKKASRFMALFLLVLLSINFVVFNYYYTKAEETSSEINANGNNLKKVNLIKERIRDKELRLSNVRNFSNSKSSYYINEIVKIIPPALLLDELTYGPLEKSIRPGEDVTVQSNTILVSGKLTDGASFTSWIEKISGYKWVKSTTILSYGKNETGESVFKIKINII